MAGSKNRPIGTAFLIAADADNNSTYVVTAKHVLLEIEAKGQKHVRLQLNRRSPGPRHVDISLADWICHPGEFNDVALARWPLSEPGEYVYSVLLRTMLLSSNDVRELGIGAGDTVRITGLFSKHTGSHTNLPVVRTGNVALINDEPIAVSLDGKDGEAVAYIVEARSIGGLSGSPVFVELENWGLGRILTRGGVPTETLNGKYYLLGLVHGHWDESLSEDSAVVDKAGESVNVGMAVVVPAADILDILDSELPLQ